MNKKSELVELLIEKGYKISFAESVTGGLLASNIIDVNNASLVIGLSYVTYSNDSKVNTLGVKEQTINDYTVVSKEVALEMVKGLAYKTKANVCVSTTGYAGPTGSDVGLVCFGIKIGNDEWTSEMRFLANERNEIRRDATDFAINKIYELLKEI